MKNKPVKITLILLASTVIWGCNGKSSGSGTAQGTMDSDTSYALGMYFGGDVKNWIDANGITPNLDEFAKGFQANLSGGKTRFDMDKVNELLDAAFNALAEGRNAEAREEENAFLAQNTRNSNVKITSSGLQYEIIKETTGPKPSADSTVLVHYEGWLIDGMIFDSSYERGSPLEFNIGMVIPGWREGIQLMSVGSEYMFYIPSGLAYGENGVEDIIPPFSTLIFSVELLDIID
jgi:FKBP-type peptidyl-prolyl cis-trans isomerase